MSQSNINDFFTRKLEPSEALKEATDEVVCLTPVVAAEVQKQLQKEEKKKTGRSSYHKYSNAERAELGKFAAQHGVAKTVRSFSAKYPGLKQQSVSEFKKKYNDMKRTHPAEAISEIAAKKRGRTSILPKELMSQTIEIVKALRLKAAPVSYSVIAAVAKGVVIARDRTLLAENGGHIKFSEDWARKILHNVMTEEKKMVSRLGSTASMPVSPVILSEVKLDFQRKIKRAQEEYSIPDELIINFDQTPLAYITASNRTMEFEGRFYILFITIIFIFIIVMINSHSAMGNRLVFQN